MAGFLDHVVRRSFESLGKIITPWLGVMLVALGVGAVAGPLPAAAATAAPHGKAAAGPPRQSTEPTATAIVCSAHMGAQPATWMGDIAPCIVNRRLTDIVIPGSHDSTTYGLDPGLAQTQSVDLIGQLNAGARQFDIRVQYQQEEKNPNTGVVTFPAGYYAYHGDIHSLWLTLNHIFSDLNTWSGQNRPNSAQEIIMISLVIDQNGDLGPFPTDECNALKNDFGLNLVTPSDLQFHFGTADPGELTFGQIWSLPQSFAGPRIIMDNQPSQQCLYTPRTGVNDVQWGPFSPPSTQTLFSGYYADQCSADGKNVSAGNQARGIQQLMNQAAATRAIPKPGTVTPILPDDTSKFGGLYVLSVQGTPEIFSCIPTPLDMVPDEKLVFNGPRSVSLVSLWFNSNSTVRDNLNVVAGDYVDGDWLWNPIVNMNVVPTPPDRPAVTGLTGGPGQVSVAFSAPKDQGTAPVTSYTVTVAPSGDAPSWSVTGPSSPITVTGLANHQVYNMTLTATNAAGTGKQFPVHWDSPGDAPAALQDGPAYKGFVGQSYLSKFTVSGMRGSRVMLESGKIPPGLTLGQDGTLKGTPTRAGAYKFGVRATNRFGYHRGVATVSISDSGAPHPETSWQEMRAKICTKSAKDRPECASRLLFGPFPRLADRAAVSLVRGPTTYATGQVTSDGRLILRHRCERPQGPDRCSAERRESPVRGALRPLHTGPPPRRSPLDLRSGHRPLALPGHLIGKRRPEACAAAGAAGQGAPEALEQHAPSSTRRCPTSSSGGDGFANPSGAGRPQVTAFQGRQGPPLPSPYLATGNGSYSLYDVNIGPGGCPAGAVMTFGEAVTGAAGATITQSVAVPGLDASTAAFVLP